jgi:serine/threonine protein phosphatase PrpC
MHLTYGAATDAGRKRSENQDSFLVDFEPELYPQRPALFVVCDGVGGAQAGKTASTLGAGEVRDAFRGATHGSLSERLIEAADKASAAILDHSARNPATEGMATTLVAAALDGERCYIVNVGDSRAYHVEGGRIERLTTDHTLIQEQLASGLITPDQAAQSPYRHIITRSLGGQPSEVGAETYPAPLLNAGESYVLCSDGLTDMVSEEDILALSMRHEPQAAAEALIDLANEHGGRDNITVIVIHVNSDT